MVKTFAAQLEEFAELTKGDLIAAARQGIQETVEDMQTPVAKDGRMRVDTGYLRNSLVSNVSGGAEVEGEDGYALVIAGMELGDVLTFAYTAEYAYPREVGSRGAPGDHFMGVAAAKFPGRMEKIARKIKR